jgi:hypothetical protein
VGNAGEARPTTLGLGVEGRSSAAQAERRGSDLVWPRPGRASYGSPRCLGCFCTLQWIHAQCCRSCVLPISLCFVSVASVHRSPSCSKIRPRRPSPCRLYPWRCATSHRVLTCRAKRSHDVPSGGLPSSASPSCHLPAAHGRFSNTVARGSSW